MALVSRTTPVRKEIPHEPGHWMEFRPVAYGRWQQAVASKDDTEILRAGLTAWSYDTPLTPEAVLDLDVKTANWAVGVVLEMNVRSKKEGEAAPASSNSSTSGQAATQPA